MKIILEGKGTVTAAVGSAALQLTALKGAQHVLLIPSAADSLKTYNEYVRTSRQVFTKLDAKVTVLHHYNKPPTPRQLANRFKDADLIWITGGNTQKAKKFFDRYGISKALKEAAETKVIGGGSAGTLLLADAGMSYSTPNAHTHKFVASSGLPFVNATVSPHVNFVEPEEHNTMPRSVFFKRFITKNKASLHPLYLGIDQEAALVLVGDSHRIITNPGFEHSGVSVYRKKGRKVFMKHYLPSAGYIDNRQFTLS